MTTTRVPNQHGGKCSQCNSWVESEAGTRLRRPEGTNPQTKWDVRHNVCPNSDAAKAEAGEVKVEFPPTPQQQAILDAFKAGKDIVVQAGAGTGKTSTQVLLAQAADKLGRKGQYTAFNAAIVAEANRKFPNTVGCNTVDSLAIRALPDYHKALEDSKRGTRKAPNNYSVAKELRVTDTYLVTPAGDEKRFTGRVQVGIAKRAFLTFCQSGDTSPGKQHFEEIPEVDDVQRDKLIAKVLPITEQFWARLQDPKDAWTAGPTLIFAAAKKVWQLSKPELPCDYILFDEAQDASGVMIEVIKHNKTLGKQIVIVGDTQQSINEWAGAIDSLPKFEALGAEVLFLTQSFRFGTSISDVANSILDRLVTELRLQGFEKVDSTVCLISDPDCILTRTNAGAVRNLIDQIKLGRTVFLAGKNAAKELLDLAEACEKLQRGERSEHPELVAFSTWSEVEEYANEDPLAGSMKLWVKLINELGTKTIIDAVNATVSEQAADVTISTVHKSKGREWNKVVIAGDFFPPNKKQGETDISVEELKLAYVAVTRAKTHLDISRVPHFTQVGGGSRWTDEDPTGW